MLSACQPAAGWRWERAEGGLSQQAAFLALAADPSDPSRLWAGYYAFGGLATSRSKCTSSPVSSRASRTAAWAADSPASTLPKPVS